MIAFATTGPGNTESVLALAHAEALSRGIDQVVVASTSGETGVMAARLFAESEVTLVIVTHNVGFKEPGTHEMTAETRAEIESLGAQVYTGTMPFRTIGTGIKEKQVYSQQDLIANTLRLLGQGVKVCVEIALMTSDAGLISTRDVITVAGTARGGDTAVVIAPQSSNRIFDLQIREILAKPVDW